MNITMTLEGDSTERLVQTVCAVIGGAQAGAAAPAQPAVPAPEKARAYKAPEPEAAPKKEPKREPEPKPEPAPEPTAAPEPKAAPARAQAPSAGVDFGTVAAAARKVVNDGKAAQKDVLAVFEAHGSKYLRSIDEAEYPAVLAELEAL